MSAPATPPFGPPQELLDFLVERGVDPAQVSYWTLIRWLLRVVRQQQRDIAAIKAFVNMP